MYFKVNYIGDIYSIAGHELKTPIIGEDSGAFYYVVSSRDELDEKIDNQKKHINPNIKLTDIKIVEFTRDEFFKLAKDNILGYGLKLYAGDNKLTQDEYEERKEAFLNDDNIVAEALAKILPECCEEIVHLPKKHTESIVS